MREQNWRDMSINERNSDRDVVMAPWMPGKMERAWVVGFNDNFVFVQFFRDKFVQQVPHNLVKEI